MQPRTSYLHTLSTMRYSMSRSFLMWNAMFLSYFINMVASHNFKWDRCAAWQFRWSPSCALAFGCCGGATPVGLPFGSSSLIFISADVVSSIGLLYSFTDLSLCTCIVSLSFASIVVAFPILAFAGLFTSFCYSYFHFAVYVLIVLPTRCLQLVHGGLFTSYPRLCIPTLHFWLS